MTLREKLNTELKTALKSKDIVTTATIRLINAAIKDRDIAARGNGKEGGIEESEILSLLQSMVKQRLDSAKTYKEAGRTDLSDREEAEIKVLEAFLPKPLTEDEVNEAIAALIAETGATSIKDMGKVMNELKSRYAGQIDMAKAGGLVKAKLG